MFDLSKFKPGTRVRAVKHGGPNDYRVPTLGIYYTVAEIHYHTQKHIRLVECPDHQWFKMELFDTKKVRNLPEWF
jgi:hypothetical protein